MDLRKLIATIFVMKLYIDKESVIFTRIGSMNVI